jgi:hypothetical protein
VAVADEDRESNVNRTLLEGGLSYKSDLCYRSYVSFSFLFFLLSLSPSFSLSRSSRGVQSSPGGRCWVQEAKGSTIVHFASTKSVTSLVVHALSWSTTQPPLSPGERIALSTGLASAPNLSPCLLDQARFLVRNNIDLSLSILATPHAAPHPFFDPETDISPGMGTLLVTQLVSLQEPPLLSPAQRHGFFAVMAIKFGPSFVSSVVPALPLPMQGVSLAEFFPLFLALLFNPPQNPSPPIAGLLSSGWSNQLPQLVLVLVDRLLSLPSDTFNFASFGSLHKVIRNETVQDAPAAIVGSTWNCLEVFEVCANGATSEDAGIRDKCKGLLEKGIKASVELVFLGLDQQPVRRKVCFCPDVI